MVKASTEFDLPTRLGKEILRCEVGSTLHGTGLPGGEDHDEMGIFLELPQTTIGLGSVEHFDKRSKPAGVRSEPGDTDLIVYSARKWARLALSGNPSVLLLLYAPEDKVITCERWGTELRANADWFSSLRAGNAFLGYMQQQRQRLTGERGTAGRVRKRADGTADTKYAMHMLRLGHQGVEFLGYGQITLPVPGALGDHLRAVRRGEVPMPEVIAEAELLESQLKMLMGGASPLPEQPNVDAVQEWLMTTHLQYWYDEHFTNLISQATRRA